MAGLFKGEYKLTPEQRFVAAIMLQREAHVKGLDLKKMDPEDRMRMEKQNVGQAIEQVKLEPVETYLDFFLIQRMRGFGRLSTKQAVIPVPIKNRILVDSMMEVLSHNPDHRNFLGVPDNLIKKAVGQKFPRQKVKRPGGGGRPRKQITRPVEYREVPSLIGNKKIRVPFSKEDVEATKLPDLKNPKQRAKFIIHSLGLFLRGAVRYDPKTNTYSITHRASGTDKSSANRLEDLFKDIYGNAPKEGGIAVGEFKKRIWGEGILGGRRAFKGISLDPKKLLENDADREAVLQAILTYGYRPSSRGNNYEGPSRLRIVPSTGSEELRKIIASALEASGHKFGKAKSLTLRGETAVKYMEKYCQEPALKNVALLILKNEPYRNMDIQKRTKKANQIREKRRKSHAKK